MCGDGCFCFRWERSAENSVFLFLKFQKQLPALLSFLVLFSCVSWFPEAKIPDNAYAPCSGVVHFLGTKLRIRIVAPGYLARS